jgi:hypothetical protein
MKIKHSGEVGIKYSSQAIKKNKTDIVYSGVDRQASDKVKNDLQAKSLEFKKEMFKETLELKQEQFLDKKQSGDIMTALKVQEFNLKQEKLNWEKDKEIRKHQREITGKIISAIIVIVFIIVIIWVCTHPVIGG